jgi:hypothetical protein
MDFNLSALELPKDNHSWWKPSGRAKLWPLRPHKKLKILEHLTAPKLLRWKLRHFLASLGWYF